VEDESAECVLQFFSLQQKFLQSDSQASFAIIQVEILLELCYMKDQEKQVTFVVSVHPIAFELDHGAKLNYFLRLQILQMLMHKVAFQRIFEELLLAVTC
jgi:hypothetical protein